MVRSSIACCPWHKRARLRPRYALNQFPKRAEIFKPICPMKGNERLSRKKKDPPISLHLIEYKEVVL